MGWRLKLAKRVVNNVCCCCSAAKSCLTLCHSMTYTMPGVFVLHYFPKLAQTHIHLICDVIQPSYPLSPPSPPALNLSQNQGLFR